MRIATWNINSVRMRLDLLLRLMEEEQPDVICLQETKVVDADFPLGPLAERGYVHAHIHGMKSYNGVAILSRLPFESQDVQHWCGKQDCRHALAHLPGGIDGPDSFWQLLVDRRSGICEVPDDRWSIDGFYDPDPKAPSEKARPVSPMR